MASGAAAGQAGTTRVVVATLLGAVGLAHDARADGPRRVELELSSGVARDGDGGLASVWSPLVTIAARAGPHGTAWVRVGATVACDGAGAVGVAASNLTAGWAQQLGEGLALKVAGVVPVARRARGADALAETGGRAIRGNWESWQWLGDHAALVGAVTWVGGAPDLVLELQPAVAFMVPTQRREGTDGIARGEGLALEARARVAVEVASGWWLGLAGQVAWTPTVTRDAGAWSLAPEVRWTSGADHVALGALVNLDAPWGPSWASDDDLPDGELAATGVRLSGGWRF